MNTIEIYLEKLGLSELESKIYLGLLSTGPTTVLELSKKLKIKRATVHFNIESLIQRGLVTQVKYGARRQIIAESPENLNVLLKERMENTEKLKVDFPDILQNIHQVIPSASENTNVEIKYYEGRNSVKHIYEDVLKAKEIRSYINSLELSRVFPENYDLFIHAHNKRDDMNMKEIITPGPEVKMFINHMNKERYKHKFFPKDMNFSPADIIIYDGKVASINLRKDMTTGFIISNIDYYNHSKDIFDFIWKIIPE